MRNHTQGAWITTTIAILFIVLAWYMVVPDIYQSNNDIPDNIKQRFTFTEHVLDNDILPKKYIRQVNQALTHIDGWISSVGAAVAIDDLDMDGLANDICLVDPRTDTVEVRIGLTAKGQSNNQFILESTNNNSVAPMGCMMGDYNEDGYLDILIYYWGKSPAIFYRNPKIKSFRLNAFERTPLLSQEEPWYTNAATQADFNGDGHIDLVFGNYFSEHSKILDPKANVACTMPESMSRACNGGSNRFFMGRGSNTSFEDVTDAIASKLLCGWTLGLGAADLNGDLLPELYVANDFGPDVLFFNTSKNGAFSLQPVYGSSAAQVPRSHQLGRDSFKGMGVDFADINNDGDLDIYVSNISQEYALRESHLAFVSTGEKTQFEKGVAPYNNNSEELGIAFSSWGWDAKFIDFDNDGYVELYQATGFLLGDTNRWPELQEVAMTNDELFSCAKHWPRFTLGDDISGHSNNAFFALTGQKNRYSNIADQLKLSPQPAVTRGVSHGDIDGDGDMDFVIANQWQPSSLFINNTQTKHKSLLLNLRLPRKKSLALPPPNSSFELADVYQGAVNVAGSSPAIGAVVKLKGTPRIQFVDGGNGHSGDDSKEIHFGLGNIDGKKALPVMIEWLDSSGKHKTIDLDLTPGVYTIFLG